MPDPTLFRSVQASAEQINVASAWVTGEISRVSTLVVDATTDDKALADFAAKGVAIVKA